MAKLRIASKTPSTLSCLVLLKEFGPFYNFHKYVFVPNPQNKRKVFEKKLNTFKMVYLMVVHITVKVIKLVVYFFSPFL
jgi:hypothetical protein